MTSITKNLYIDKLDNIVNKYNNTYHTTIKMKPVDIKHSTYIKLTAENFAARLARANLPRKNYIAILVKKTDFDNKLKNLNKKELQFLTGLLCSTERDFKDRLDSPK